MLGDLVHDLLRPLHQVFDLPAHLARHLALQKDFPSLDQPRGDPSVGYGPTIQFEIHSSAVTPTLPSASFGAALSHFRLTSTPSPRIDLSIPPNLFATKDNMPPQPAVGFLEVKSVESTLLVCVVQVRLGVVRLKRVGRHERRYLVVSTSFD